MKIFTAVICALLTACSMTLSSTSSTSSTRHISTHGLKGSVRMTQTGSGGMDREFEIKDGHLWIRFEHSGVSLDLSEFPGDEITRYFDSLEAPMEFKLPDGTRFVYHGDSFEVDGETYELEPGSGMSSFSRVGLLINP